MLFTFYFITHEFAHACTTCVTDSAQTCTYMYIHTYMPLVYAALLVKYCDKHAPTHT